MAELVLVHGPMGLTGPVVTVLTAGRLVIGRDPAYAPLEPGVQVVVIPHYGMGRRHAEIVRTAAGYAITDLGSRCGFYVNRKHIRTHFAGTAPLADGDVIRIGDFEYEFHDPGETPVVVTADVPGA